MGEGWACKVPLNYVSLLITASTKWNAKDLTWHSSSQGDNIGKSRGVGGMGKRKEGGGKGRGGKGGGKGGGGMEGERRKQCRQEGRGEGGGKGGGEMEGERRKQCRQERGEVKVGCHAYHLQFQNWHPSSHSATAM